MATVIADSLTLCDCCALKLANDDTSGCESSCGAEHTERLLTGFANLTAGVPTIGCACGDCKDGQSWQNFGDCAGCGDDMSPGEYWHASILR